MWKRSQRGEVELIENLDDYEPLDELQNSASHPQEVFEAKENRRAVIDVLDLLSDKNRLTARLFYVDGLSYQEISDILGVPITTIQSRLHKARKRLKNEIVRIILGKQVKGKCRNLEDRLKLIAKRVYKMDAIRLEIGWELIPFVKTDVQAGNILFHVKQIREALAAELQFSMPPVRIRDDVNLPSRGYKLFILENPVVQGELRAEDDAAVLSSHLAECVKKHRDDFVTS